MSSRRHSTRAYATKARRRWVESLRPGTFTGTFTLRWLGPERFLYIPDPTDPLTYHRANGEIITPGRMTTDGGSIAPILQVLSGVSRWSYAWAFIVHDWEWERRRQTGKSMDEVNLTLVEGMRSMQLIHELLPESIPDVINVWAGVNSIIARRRWAMAA